jgi:hypothetical protein
MTAHPNAPEPSVHGISHSHGEAWHNHADGDAPHSHRSMLATSKDLREPSDEPSE